MSPAPNHDGREPGPFPGAYAVIFTSMRRETEGDGYDELSDRMVELARRQPGFLGVESARSADGLGVTVSYWDSLEAIADWKRHAEHLEAQRRGRKELYTSFTTRICRIERQYSFTRNAD